MRHALVIVVHLHDSRYHGLPEWPPSPFRLFQALVAGAAVGDSIPETAVETLEWLEGCEPPLIAAPSAKRGQRLKLYMPNNDLDAVGRDPRRIGEIRKATKFVRPRLFEADYPFVYAWVLGGNHERHSRATCALAERLYQFGRGADMAWATAGVLSEAELEAQLSTFMGRVFRPSEGNSTFPLQCPERGSLKSLIARHQAARQRFKTEWQGRATRQLFSTTPAPRFSRVAYNAPRSPRLYELRSDHNASLASWPLARPSQLVEWLRDAAVARLERNLLIQGGEIEGCLVGRKADGSNAALPSSRVRIIPLPSIGHHHVDRSIRRVLIEMPSGGSISEADLHWAFSGMDVADPATGEMLGVTLTRSEDETMLAHYGATEGAGDRVWRTVTPVALPRPAQRRRIAPGRHAAEAKGGGERRGEHARAAAAVVQALRHSEIRSFAESIRVQREPFEAHGERAELFAHGTRFAKERLWHVEIIFRTPIRGPLIIGDGRFLGLGLMAPHKRAPIGFAFAIENGLVHGSQPIEIAQALRRAVMARVQETIGRRGPLPPFFTGHTSDGSPARTEHDPHLAFVFDPAGARLLIVAPHCLERRDPGTRERAQLAILDEAMAHFHDLRAGAAGRLTLHAIPIDLDADCLFAPARTWQTVTDYQVTRHAKDVGAAKALVADLIAECRRRGLPDAHVTPLETRGIAGVGLIGKARLAFAVAVRGPLILGRSRHLGGGLFAASAAE